MRRKKTDLRLVIAFLLGTLASPPLFRTFSVNAQTATLPCAGSTPADVAEGGQAVPESAPPAETPPAVDGTTGPGVGPRARFSEVFPDPEGADDLGEFIEIENVRPEDADLAGWSIRASSGKTFPIAVRIGAGGRYAFLYAETKIALVNSGSTLTLLDAAGGTADTIAYPGPAKTGKSYARKQDGAWEWTSQPTPGEENRFDPPPPVPAPVPVERPSVETAPAAIEASAGTGAAPTGVAAGSRPIIVRFLPDPTGDDEAEWIELGAASDADAVLDGWTLDDAEGGSDAYRLDGLRVPAGGRLRIARAASKIALNNDGDAVRLIAPDGTIADAVTYGKAPEGKTYELTPDGWRWTDAEASGTDATAPVAASTGSGEAPPDPGAPAAAQDDGGGTAIGDAVEAVEEASVGDVSPDDDATVDVAGIVTLAPGVVGKKTFAIADDTGGIFVRAYGTSSLPALAAGDTVRVRGRGAAAGLSTTGREVTRISPGKVAYAELTLDEIGADANGTAAAVTGTVTHAGKSTMIVADAGLHRELILRAGPGVRFPAVASGATVTAKGVIRARGDRPELIVPTKDGLAVAGPARPPVPDARPAPAEDAKEELAPPKRPIVLGDAEKNGTPGVALAATAALGVFAVTAVAVMRKRREAELARLAADR